MKLKNPALILYFVSYILYQIFFRLKIDKEVALLFKPMIVASILFYYYFYNNTHNKSKLHFIILGILFIADNVNLLMETIFYQLALSLYLVILFVFMYLILRDSMLLKKGSKIDKYLGIATIVGIVSFLLLKIVSLYIVKQKFHSYYFVTNYIIVFGTVLIFSFYNFFKHKTLSSRFLLLTLLSLFLSDIFYVVNQYYYSNKAFIIIACFIELPCYYFLVNYFINRDVEQEKLDNNISS
ncbi:hypothetical protein [Flavobacterium okayamense]|uniref:YhhN-like protein n=1 Tax=Flavobacterium okayamense TaxID=2830782 RepID=A0ABM7S9S2_9FLAO|nr:hypothetical protein [Flavobacterium okayamense]BCY29506.1 hypothetical protein KK2020170_23740 [Flavobacterium okayamense]